MDDIIVAESAANAALDTFVIDTVSLHSDNPGTTGSNEISGGGYSRQAFSFAPASGGKRVANAAAVFNVQSGASILWVAYWSGSTFTLARKESSAIALSADGTCTLPVTTELEL